MALKIGEAAKELGVSIDTLRYWEKEGIVTIQRKESGYRHYDDTDMLHLKYIIVLKHVGFSLSEIRDIAKAPFLSSRTERIENYNELITAKIAELDQIVSSYQQAICLLSESLSIAGGSASCSEDQKRLDDYVVRAFASTKTNKNT